MVGLGMDCSACKEVLSDFVLDELSEKDHALVATHLEDCADCRARSRELKVTGKALQAVPALKPVAATPTLQAKIMKDARAESEKIIKALPPDKRRKAERMREMRDAARVGMTDEVAHAGMPWPQLAAAIAVLALLVITGIYFLISGFRH